jgi:hypothetical protein
MHYIIQENVFREQHYDMLENSIKRLGLNYTTVRVFPFVDKVVDIKEIPDGPFNVDDLPDLVLPDNNVFCFGGLKLARIGRS